MSVSIASPTPDITAEIWHQGVAHMRQQFPACSDGNLIWRYLVANDGDGPKAEAQLRATLDWRAQNDADSILAEFPPSTRVTQLKELYPHFFHGTGRDGRPVYVDQVGRLKSKALLKQFALDEIAQYHIFFQEYFWNVLAPVTGAQQSIVILDLKHASLLGIPWSVIKSQMKTDNDHYPERLFRLYIVNAPSLFSVIWRTVSPWLDPRTQDKINVLTNSNLDRLQEDVDITQLPAEYGGTGGQLGSHTFETAYMNYVAGKPDSATSTSDGTMSSAHDSLAVVKSDPPDMECGVMNGPDGEVGGGEGVCPETADEATTPPDVSATYGSDSDSELMVEDAPPEMLTERLSTGRTPSPHATANDRTHRHSSPSAQRILHYPLKSTQQRSPVASPRKLRADSRSRVRRFVPAWFRVGSRPKHSTAKHGTVM